MAFGNNNRGNGFAGLRWKKSNYGTSATMWFRPTKKPGVFKYTLSFGTKTVTMLIDQNTGMQMVNTKNGSEPRIAVKCLFGGGHAYFANGVPTNWG